MSSGVTRSGAWRWVEEPLHHPMTPSQVQAWRLTGNILHSLAMTPPPQPPLSQEAGPPKVDPRTSPAIPPSTRLNHQESSLDEKPGISPSSWHRPEEVG